MSGSFFFDRGATPSCYRIEVSQGEQSFRRWGFNREFTGEKTWAELIVRSRVEKHFLMCNSVIRHEHVICCFVQHHFVMTLMGEKWILGKSHCMYFLPRLWGFLPMSERCGHQVNWHVSVSQSEREREWHLTLVTCDPELDKWVRKESSLVFVNLL